MNKKKRNSEKHTEIFLEFLIFLKESRLKKGENQKQEKLFTRESSQQAKEEDKVIWALCQINNNANESHSTFSSWSSPRYDTIKGK